MDQNERLLSNRSLIEDDDVENQNENEQLVDYNLKVGSMSNVTQDEDVRGMTLVELRMNAGKMESMFDILDAHKAESITYYTL